MLRIFVLRSANFLFEEEFSKWLWAAAACSKLLSSNFLFFQEDFSKPVTQVTGFEMLSHL